MSLYHYCLNDHRKHTIQSIVKNKISQVFRNINQSIVRHYISLYLEDVARFFQTKIIKKITRIKLHTLFNKFIMWLYSSKAITQMSTIFTNSYLDQNELLSRIQRLQSQLSKKRKIKDLDLEMKRKLNRLLRCKSKRLASALKKAESCKNIEKLILSFQKIRINNTQSEGSQDSVQSFNQMEQQIQQVIDDGAKSVANSQYQVQQVRNRLEQISINQHKKSIKELQKSQIHDFGRKVQASSQQQKDLPFSKLPQERKDLLLKKLRFLLVCPQQYGSDNYHCFDRKIMEDSIYHAD